VLGRVSSVGARARESDTSGLGEMTRGTIWMSITGTRVQGYTVLVLVLVATDGTGIVNTVSWRTGSYAERSGEFVYLSIIRTSVYLGSER